LSATLNPDAIPHALKAIPQWVLWKLEERNGKATKTPYQAHGALAKVNDPTTWTTYDKTLAAYQAGGFSGMGIVLTKETGIVGTDLDKCLNPDTGELESEAARIVSELPTYCEVSPSGRGLRLFGFGTLPQGGRRKGKVELYEEGRYLTVTGNRFNGHDALADITTEIAAVHARIFAAKPHAASPPVDTKPTGALDLSDAALIEKATRAKNGSEFVKLWAGDTSLHGNDDSAADLALCNLLAFWTAGDADRVDRLFRQSGLLQAPERLEKWDKPHFSDGRTYGQATVAKAIADVQDGYSGRKPMKKTNEPGQELATTETLLALPTVSRCTHLANSYRIRHYYHGRLWYALGLGWIMWTGKFWRPDPTNEGSIATGFVDGLSRLIAKESAVLARNASEEADEDRRKAMMEQSENLIKWAVQSENERVIASGLKLTKHALLIEYSTLNADPWLFNVQNGTVDLSTGTLRPHNPADLITFISPVTYDATATYPTWERFLSEVFAGDTEMVAFIQRAIGWSLTGVVKERALFFLHGHAGKNGKTTMVEAIMKLVGNYGESCYGYGRKVGAETFMKSRNMEDNQRKAATLAGPRFICTSEVDEEHRLNEQLIKDITGGDTIEGRRLYQEAFTFKPQFKPWMYGNHKPEIRGTDDAIWSRVRLVPFEVSFRGREDLELAGKLEKELPGILNWAIQGCLDWQRIGLKPPAKVQAATDEYREEMDVFGPFIRECCVIHRTAEVRANDLWNAYKVWCDTNGVKEQTQTRFGKYLSSKGFPIEKSSIVKRIGIGLLDPVHSDSGRVGIVGIVKPESTYSKPPMGTFPPNPPNPPNPPKTSEAVPEETGISSHQSAASPSVDNKKWGEP
jgi:putative DNA primase/helicase